MQPLSAQISFGLRQDTVGCGVSTFSDGGLYMLYVIMWDDVENSLPLRQSARPQHLARVEELRNQGRLVIGGPFPAIDAEDPGAAGFTGSLIIAEFDSQHAAQDWIDNDPYAQVGVFSQATVKPFKKVAP